MSESLVKVKKKAKVLELRKGKEGLLKREYENFQRCLHGDKSVPLCSTRQQAERLLRRGNSSPTKNTQRSPEETFIKQTQSYTMLAKDTHPQS